jgi:glycosyltransferase involved in cell wall biosynthesis
MKISFIIPSRNNLKYLQQAVDSITECYGNEHDIVLLDDASTDGTWDWIQSLQGEHFIKYRNEGPDRVGHTILYDKGVELSRTEVFSILHADMITTKNHIPNSLKHIKPGAVVAATRIEPPLHPPGIEKYVRAFGFEPEEFNRNAFLQDVAILEQENLNKHTNGIFAPWMMYKSDFKSIGGHDPLFAPMELEDSDIFNRMHLAGYELIQSRDSFVYHMTCRGSRFKDGIEIEKEILLPDGTIWYKPKDSEEYKALRAIKFREWWRKWGQNVLHDDLMMPMVLPKYNVSFRVENCSQELLQLLEPWCDRIYSDAEWMKYVTLEQPKTKYDLRKRCHSLTDTDRYDYDDIVVEIDGKRFSQQDYNLIENLSAIIQDSGELGTFEIGNLKVTIMNIQDRVNELIICK